MSLPARLAMVGAVALEAVVMGAWLRWLAATLAAGTRPPPTIALVAIGCAAVVAARLALRLGPAGRLLMPVGAAAAALVVARLTLFPGLGPADASWLSRLLAELVQRPGMASSAVLVAGATVIVWWRGTRRGSQVLLPRSARRAVAVAIAVITVLAVAVKLTRPVDLGAHLVATAALALGLLALTRVDEAGRGPGGTPFRLGVGWAVVLATAIVAVFLVATLLGAFVSLEVAGTLIAALAPLPEVIGRLVLLALLLVIELAMIALRPVALLLEAGVAEWVANLGALPQEPSHPPVDNTLAPTHLAPWLERTLRALVAFVVLTAVAIWLARSLQRYTTATPEDASVEREIKLRPGRVAADAMGLARLFGSRVAAALARLRYDRPDGARRYYAAMLHMLARRGMQRRTAETPSEFEVRAGGWLPDGVAGLAVLTAAYLPERYGGRPSDHETLRHLPGALATIRHAVEGRDAPQ